MEKCQHSCNYGESNVNKRNIEKAMEITDADKVI